MKPCQWVNGSKGQWVNGSMDQWVNGSMGQYLLELRGTPVIVFDYSTSTLLHMFEYKNNFYKILSKDHRT